MGNAPCQQPNAQEVHISCVNVTDDGRTCSLFWLCSLRSAVGPGGQNFEVVTPEGSSQPDARNLDTARALARLFTSSAAPTVPLPLAGNRQLEFDLVADVGSGRSDQPCAHCYVVRELTNQQDELWIVENSESWQRGGIGFPYLWQALLRRGARL